ncbi:MAG: flagellar biosynthetic protein FliO [Leptospiraceae bacterium]|nr:flagellar biosynthetic protein FliO [Leptospiraceae bacterium]MCP5510698.1 flagellar biosynthetic protein FliO [Leptospiraceae bacterium]
MLRLGKFFFVFILIFFSPLLPQEEDLNNALQKELGIEEKQTKPPEPTKVPEKVPEEVNPVQERFREQSEPESLLWILVKISIVLVILVGVFYYLVRFFSVTRNARFPVKGVMRVLSTLPIGPGKELQIVDLSGELLLIGVSENSINLIKEIESPDLKQKVYMMRDVTEPEEENFVEQLLKNLKTTPFEKKSGSVVVEERDTDDVVEELKLRQLDRLEKLKEERKSLSKKDLDNPKENESFLG